MVLALIGGLTGLIWDTLGYSLGNYESFRFNTSLISEIYSTTNKVRMMRGQEPKDLDSANADLNKSMDTCKSYEYNYSEYLTTWFILKLCCCLKDKDCFKRR